MLAHAALGVCVGRPSGFSACASGGRQFPERPQPLVAGRPRGVRTWTVPIGLRRNLMLWAP